MGKIGKICQLPWKEHHFLQYNLVFPIHINFDYFLSGLLATTCVFLYQCELAYYTKSLTLPFLQQLLKNYSSGTPSSGYLMLCYCAFE